MLVLEGQIHKQYSCNLTDSVHSAVEEGHFNRCRCSAVGERLMAPQMLLLALAFQLLFMSIGRQLRLSSHVQ